MIMSIIGLKNTLIEFLWVIDQVLFSLLFDRCYTDDVIIFSSTP
uniref:Reverse transcriptase domain-containing protein n=1 Tax=Physcomitrium patens TaxID=3218 RepID=A0A2K1L493_PHYPA|nr:hypothetical protein PHYPA_003624 [Physcomitrium patens]